MEGPVRTVSFEALAAQVGQEIGVSAWTRIDQPMIDAFAKLTGDSHFIHVDPARAAAVLPSSLEAQHQQLTMFELEKAFYELRYEVDHRPDWVGIPVDSIIGLLEGELV